MPKLCSGDFKNKTKHILIFKAADLQNILENQIFKKKLFKYI